MNDMEYIRSTGGNGGWQKPLLGTLWAIVFLLVGWMWTDARTLQNETRADIAKIQAERAADLVRIGVLEEAVRNQRESLQRIEVGVNELRTERRR